jgi:hypothetical protein
VPDTPLQCTLATALGWVLGSQELGQRPLAACLELTALQVDRTDGGSATQRAFLLSLMFRGKYQTLDPRRREVVG